MKSSTSKTHRLRSRTFTVLFGSIVLIIITAVVYGEICHSCNVTSATDENLFVSDSTIPPGTSVMLVADPVTEWNQYAATLSLTTTPVPAPVQQTRLMAIVHVSIHDAVNGITGEYETYLSPGQAPDGASAEAAATAAAYQSMLGLFGNGPFPTLGNKTLSQLYSESLLAHGLSSSDPGIGYGASAAAAILAARSNDGAAQAQFAYDGPNVNPGTWKLLPGQTALLPGWGNVTPFVLQSGSQFRPDAPPALDSEVYTRDYNEIKEIGRANSTTRTALQSQIAQFWRSSPTAIWNPVIRQALAANSFDLSETARAYALFYMAASDASVACWDAKYAYNFWRPQSAIRRGNEDGNDATDADPTWAPFITTPPHPDYASGHATNSSSMAEVLESLFGNDPGITISVTLSGITRNWSTFDEAIQEVIDARVYSGIHFRNSDVVGARQGRQVAQFVITHALRPCQGKRFTCG